MCHNVSECVLCFHHLNAMVFPWRGTPWTRFESDALRVLSSPTGTCDSVGALQLPGKQLSESQLPRESPRISSSFISICITSYCCIAYIACISILSIYRIIYTPLYIIVHHCTCIYICTIYIYIVIRKQRTSSCNHHALPTPPDSCRFPWPGWGSTYTGCKTPRPRPWERERCTNHSYPLVNNISQITIVDG